MIDREVDVSINTQAEITQQASDGHLSLLGQDVQTSPGHRPYELHPHSPNSKTAPNLKKIPSKNSTCRMTLYLSAPPYKVTENNVQISSLFFSPHEMRLI